MRNCHSARSRCVAQAPKNRAAQLVRRVLAFGLCAASIFGASCRDARFPVCKEDAECADAKGKKCVDLRCVECRGDDECGDGRFCERKTASCKNLGAPRPAATEEPAPTSSDPEAGKVE